jgi:hypothetical protein
MNVKDCLARQDSSFIRNFFLVTLLSFFITSTIVIPTTVVAAEKVGPCTYSSLTPKVGKSGAAAGTTYINLKIINHSKSKCSLTGIPGAQTGFQSYSRSPFVAVGLASSKVTYSRRGGTVWLAPLATASVEFSISNAGNYVAKKCIAKNINVVQITFNFGKSVVRLLYPLPKIQVCTKIANTFIAGVALGIRFP